MSITLNCSSPTGRESYFGTRHFRVVRDGDGQIMQFEGSLENITEQYKQRN